MTVITEELLQSIRNLGMSFDPNKVPEQERQSKWFKTLEHLVKNLLKSKNPKDSLFIKTLFDNSHCSWHILKKMIEWAESNIKNWEQIFGLSNKIKGNPSPDIVMYSALSEVTAAKYLYLNGFRDIIFNKKGVDLQASFNGQHWIIEATFVSGEDFKTQEVVYPSKLEGVSPTYRLDSTDLIEILKSKYNQESKQFRNIKGNENKLIVIMTYLMETYALWLSHNEVNGNHPILDFVINCEIPTVVIGAGSIYEPHTSFVKESFPINDLKF